MKRFAATFYALNGRTGRRTRRSLDRHADRTWFFDGTSLETKSLSIAKNRARRLFQLLSSFTA
jgi:hypothetical protein